MADPFYTLRFTDPTKSPFIVNPNTANGPVSPNSSAFPPGVVSANTTLQLLGRGSFDYGQPIQQDLIYMLENFANSTAPSYPIEGQLWFKNNDNTLYVYDGAAWRQIVVSGGLTSNLDMNGFRIVELGDPVATTDAVNLGYADNRYVNAGGDTMTGTLTLSGGSSHVILPNAPTTGTHATNKTYVDTTITAEVATQVAAAVAAATGGYPSQFVDITGDTMTGTLTLSTGNVAIQSGDLSVSLGNIDLPIGNFSMVAGNISITNGNLLMTNGSITNAAGSLTLTTGNFTVGGTSTHGGLATFNGAVQFNGAATITNTSFTVAGPSGLIDMSTNRIINLGDPILGTDAANKDYVDAAVGTSGGDGVVYGGTVDGTSGAITLFRTLGLPDVVLAGAAAPFTHTQASPTILHNVDPPFDPSYFRDQFIDQPIYPSNVTLADVLNIIDQRFSRIARPNARQVIVSNGVQTVFPTTQVFRVGYNEVMVFVDGVKWIASEHGNSLIEMSPEVNIGTITGLLNATSYAINLTVDGTLYTNFTITTAATGDIRYYELVNLIDARLATLAIPAVAVFDAGLLQIISTTAGAGSSVVVAAPSAGNNLLTSLSSSTNVTNTAVTVDYAYEETGIPFQESDVITFNSPAPLGSVIEIISALR